MVDWVALRNEYIVGGNRVTHRSLAIKYGLKENTVDKRAERDGWTQFRKEYREGVTAEVLQVAKAFDVDTMEKKLKDDAVIFKRLKAKGISDVFGVYPEGTKARGQILKPRDLLAVMQAERKLIEFVHGEEPMPDQVHRVGLKLVGFDLSKLLGKK